MKPLSHTTTQFLSNSCFISISNATDPWVSTWLNLCWHWAWIAIKKNRAEWENKPNKWQPTAVQIIVTAMCVRKILLHLCTAGCTVCSLCVMCAAWQFKLGMADAHRRHHHLDLQTAMCFISTGWAAQAGLETHLWWFYINFHFFPPCRSLSNWISPDFYESWTKWSGSHR